MCIRDRVVGGGGGAKRDTVVQAHTQYTCCTFLDKLSLSSVSILSWMTSHISVSSMAKTALVPKLPSVYTHVHYTLTTVPHGTCNKPGFPCPVNQSLKISSAQQAPVLTLTLWSSLAVISSWPLGEKVSLLMGPPWPRMLPTCRVHGTNTQPISGGNPEPTLCVIATGLPFLRPVYTQIQIRVLFKKQLQSFFREVFSVFSQRPTRVLGGSLPTL